MKIIIDESYKVSEDSRLYEVLLRVNMLIARDQNSWSGLFNTAAYQRRKIHIDKVWKHAHKLIARDIRRRK